MNLLYVHLNVAETQRRCQRCVKGLKRYLSFYSYKKDFLHNPFIMITEGHKSILFFQLNVSSLGLTCVY